MAPKESRNLTKAAVATDRGHGDGLGALDVFASAVDRWIPIGHARFTERSEAWRLAYGPDVPMPRDWKEAQRLLRACTVPYLETQGWDAESKTTAAIKCPTCQDEPVEALRCPTCGKGGPTESVKPSEPIKAESSGNPLEDAIRDIVRPLVESVETSVDASQVLDIVKTYAETLTPKIQQYVYKDCEPVEIDGLAHKALDDVLAIIAVGGMPWLVGPAGTGKSTLARQVADVLQLDSASQGCNPQMSVAYLFGYMDAHGNYVSTRFRECYENGGVFLLDEIDGSHPSVLIALNDALASQVASFPDGMVNRSANFVCIVAANTFGRGGDREYVGTSQLNAATVDRFTMVEVDYDDDLEKALAVAAVGAERGPIWLGIIRKLRANAATHGIKCIISTRAVEAARFLDSFDAERVLDMSVFKGISDTQKSKLTDGLNLADLAAVSAA